MIIILGGADASAKNLGQISIKTIDDMQPSTRDLLALMGKTWSDEKKIAIDDFLVAFNAASWKSKVKVLYLPILFPPVNGLTKTILNSGIYKKNIANLLTDLTVTANLIIPGYALAQVNDNGIALIADGSGNFSGNTIAFIDTTAFGITNKACHYGLYYKATTIFSAGSASSTNPYASASAGGENFQLFNSMSRTSTNAAPHKNLFILNGSITANAGKSYVKDGLVATTLIGTQAEAVQTFAPFTGIASSNVAGDSTCCLMTFGDYLLDAELTEYAGLINKLLTALVV